MSGPLTHANFLMTKIDSGVLRETHLLGTPFDSSYYIRVQLIMNICTFLKQIFGSLHILSMPL